MAWEALLRVASVYEDASLGTMLLPGGPDATQSACEPPLVGAHAASAQPRKRPSGPPSGGPSLAHKARRTPSRPEAGTAPDSPGPGVERAEAVEDNGAAAQAAAGDESRPAPWARLPTRRDVCGWLAHRRSCLASPLDGLDQDAGEAARLRDASARTTRAALEALGAPGGHTPVLSYRWQEGGDVAASCRALYTLAEALCAVLAAYVNGSPAPDYEPGAAATSSPCPAAPGARSGAVSQQGSRRASGPSRRKELEWGRTNGVPHPALVRAMAERCEAAHRRIALARGDQSGAGALGGRGGLAGAPVLREVREEGVGEEPPPREGTPNAPTVERRVVVFVVPPRYLLRAGVARERERDAFFAALAPLVALASPVAAVRLVPNRFAQFRPLSAAEALAQAMKTYDRLGTGAFSHAAFTDGAVEYRPRCLSLPTPNLLPHRASDMVAALSAGSVGPPWTVMAPAGDRGASDDDSSETEVSGLDSGPEIDAMAHADAPHHAHEQEGDTLGRQGVPPGPCWRKAHPHHEGGGGAS